MHVWRVVELEYLDDQFFTPQLRAALLERILPAVPNAAVLDQTSLTGIVGKLLVCSCLDLQNVYLAMLRCDDLDCVWACRHALIFITQ